MENKLLRIMAVCGCLAAVVACSENEHGADVQLVEGAGLLEEGRMLSPGDTLHLTGKGYAAGDEVMLEFYWDTGVPGFPQGYIKGCRADILKADAGGMSIRLPYRKPESTVKVMLLRSGDMMYIGEVDVESGLTPGDSRLYGIRNSLPGKETWTDDEPDITRCPPDNGGYSRAKWPLGECSDFHSVVSCWRCYGLCGLTYVHGMHLPVFFDFCTSEWKELSNRPTLALFGFPSGVGALQAADGKNYSLNVVTDGLERCDFAVASSRTDPVPQPEYPLPDGLEASQFGAYPAAYTGTSVILLSADKGNGVWTPVAFSPYSGFHVFDDIEADGLIPFSFLTKDNKWQYGYVVARKDATNGSELYLSDLEKDGGITTFGKPYAVFPNCALSVSADYQQPGSLTVHFVAYRTGNVTYNFIADTKEWNSVDYAFGETFDEIVWTN